jgi:hypothetical protein
MDLWFGYLNQPTIGRAILGKDGYAGLMGRLKEGEHAIFIIAATAWIPSRAPASSAAASTTGCRCARTRTASPSATSTT